MAYVLVARGHCLKGIFVSYPEDQIGWEVYIPSLKKVFVSKDTIFDELQFPRLAMKDPAPLPPLSDFLDLVYPAAYNNDASDAATTPGLPTVVVPADSASDDGENEELLNPMQINPAPLEVPVDPLEVRADPAPDPPRPAPIPGLTHPQPPPQQLSMCLYIPVVSNAGYCEAIQCQDWHESLLE
ncbi:hypothetical protein H0H87_006284 [Tephrocybe sp. NHM501043]|nr:hypothetical protein H0H87_006284 [Tephrocybe sp. NHM501043]